MSPHLPILQMESDNPDRRISRLPVQRALDSINARELGGIIAALCQGHGSTRKFRASLTPNSYH